MLEKPSDCVMNEFKEWAGGLSRMGLCVLKAHCIDLMPCYSEDWAIEKR